jgi:predicted peroxiredoxin
VSAVGAPPHDPATGPIPVGTTGHLIIDSQGPWSGPGSARLIRDATRLAASGQTVWLWLVGDGVSAALASVTALGDLLARAGTGGGGVWVDRFSLRQRGLDVADLVDGVTVVDIDAVAALLLRPGVRAVWR